MGCGNAVTARSRLVHVGDTTPRSGLISDLGVTICRELSGLFSPMVHDSHKENSTLKVALSLNSSNLPPCTWGIGSLEDRPTWSLLTGAVAQ